MTKLDQVRDRYRHDTMFHTYVDMMRKCIVDLHLTPGELRDAAMLAALIELEWRRQSGPFGRTSSSTRSGGVRSRSQLHQSRKADDAAV